MIRRCSSPICVVVDGRRGREFEVPDKATGIAERWCPECIKLAGEIGFFASTTADMIRQHYQQYIKTNLPKEVKLILEQFTLELLRELGQEEI